MVVGPHLLSQRLGRRWGFLLLVLLKNLCAAVREATDPPENHRISRVSAREGRRPRRLRRVFQRNHLLAIDPVMKGLVHGSLVCIASGYMLSANAEPMLKLGVIGDSLSDEYFEDSTRAYAQNWLQQLAENRTIDPGPTAQAARQPQGTWGPPRGTGYAYNWSAAFGTAQSLLSSGQAPGLAAQIVLAGIDCAVLAIGANDFHPYGNAYAGIYNGAWSPARVRAYERECLNNLKRAVVIVRRTGVPLILVNIPDVGATPAVATAPRYADAANREKVTATIQNLNAQLRQLATTYQVSLVDWFSLAQAMTGPPTNQQLVFVLGGVPIMMQQTDPGPGLDANPTAGFVADGFHPHTVVQGVLANAIMQALDLGTGANLSLFTDAEILDHAGLAAGSSGSLIVGSYTNFVFLPVPLGPIGAFQFIFPIANGGQTSTTNWSLQLTIRTKVNSRNALPQLSATAQLSLAGGTIVFPEVAARYSHQSGYTLVFARGTNATLNPPQLATPTTLVIRNLTFSSTNGTWQPLGGRITCRQGSEILSGIVN